MLHFIVTVPMDDGRRDVGGGNHDRQNAVISTFRDLPAHFEGQWTYILVEGMAGTGDAPIHLHPIHDGGRTVANIDGDYDDGETLAETVLENLLKECRRRNHIKETKVLLHQIQKRYT